MRCLAVLLVAWISALPASADNLSALDDIAIATQDDFYHFMGKPMTFKVGGSEITYTFTPIGHVRRESGPNAAEGRFGMNVDGPVVCMEFPGESPTCMRYVRYGDVLVLRDQMSDFRMESAPAMGKGLAPWPKPVKERCDTLKKIHKSALADSFDILEDIGEDPGMTSVMAPPFLWSRVRLGEDFCRIQPTENGPELQCQETLAPDDPAGDTVFEEHVGQFRACFGKDVTVSGIDLQVEAHGLDFGYNPNEKRIAVFKLKGKDRILMNLETRPFCDPRTHKCEDRFGVWITWETPPR